MEKIIITECELSNLLSKIVSEGISDLNIVNTNNKYNFTYIELNNLYNDLFKVYKFIQDNAELSQNSADVNDKINRIKRSLKLIGNKIN